MITGRLLPPLLLQAGLRFYVRHPGQLALTIAGIALGVAAIVAIDLAAYSSRQAFAASTRLFRGQATHEVTPAGSPIPDSAVALLRRELGATNSAPVIETRLRFAAQVERAVTLLGIDPFSAGRLQTTWLGGPPTGDSFTRLMTEPGAVLLSSALAAELDAAPGDRLALLEPPGAGELLVTGLLSGNDDERYVLADIATVQSLPRRSVGLSRIDLRLEAGQADQLAPELARRGWRLRPVAARLGQIDSITRSFRINLQALSLLAMLVGAFLVYSTVAFAVVRRRESFGLFRSLGTQRRQVFALVLAEILVLSAAGVVLGLLSGIVLGAGLVRLVLRTIGDLYLSSSVDYYGVSALLLAKATAIGFGASFAAAAIPALEAARARPRIAMNRSALERRRRRQLLPRLLAAAGLGVVAAGILVGTARLEPAFAGIFAALTAAALAAPVLVYGVMHWLAGTVPWLPLSYAARSVAANLSRTGPAVAALMLAVATFSGVGLMIGSFRISVSDWLGYSLDADVLVRPDQPAALATGAREAELLQALRALPGVADVSRSRRVALPDGTGLGGLLAVDPAPSGRWPQAEGARDAILERLAAADRVLVSESFARKRELGPGDAVNLLTAAGERRFEIDAIFTDYTTDLGLVAMHLPRYRSHFDDRQLDSIGLFAEPGREDEVLEAAQELAAARGDLSVTTSAWVRELSLEIFDRTFTITQVLRLIAGLVAVIAVVNALQAQRLDSRRELATLRALGLSPGQLLRLGELQTLLLGAAAGLLAVPVGVLLAWLLIVVVNRIAFGWSMVFDIDWALLGQAVALAAVAGLAAGWLPNRRALRDMPAVALRED
ncbi:MAG: ABC transporter permease [Chromatiales bacterium]|nr:MAG: ABC transporter permease [Chromatiales bacterium]